MVNLRSIVFPLFFLSGFAGLVYETVWVRQFEAVFGSTAGSVGAVIAVFMLGMAVGGCVLGRVGDRVKSRLALFAILEGLVGLYGILSSYAFGVVEEIYYGGGFPPLLLRFLLAGAFLIVPTFLMGGSLPVLSRFALVEKRRNFGAAAGALYATGTLGAALGTFTAGFYLMEHLGNAVSLRAAGGLSLAVAAAALLVSLAIGAGEGPGEEERAEAPSSRAGPPPSFLSLLPDLAAFFLAGAAPLAMEVLWTRLLGQFFRNSVYSFSAMLLSVLLGLAAGGAAGAWISERLKTPRRALILFQLGAAAILTVSLSLFRFFPDLDGFRSFVLSLGGGESFGRLVLIEIALSFCVVFPGAFCMGTAFPLMAAMNWRRPSRFGGFVGDVQFVITAGAVAGSLVTAFLLIPSGIGLRASVLIAAGFNGAAGLVLLASAPRRAGLPVLAAAAAFLAAAVAVPALGSREPLRFWRGPPGGEKLVFYREDAMANVAVVEGPGGLVMKVNNTAGLGGTAGVFLETRLGLFPPLLQGKAKSGLCLGLGTGNTLMGMIHGGVKTADCVEIVPGVLLAAHFFHDFAREKPPDCALSFYQMDARVFLSGVSKTYDVIVGDLYFPWEAGAGFLYTKEHFAQVKEHLNPGGLFCQWIPLYQLHWDDFGIIGYTFSEVFDDVAVFLADAETDYPVVGLVGTAEPLKIDPRAMQKRLDRHEAKPLVDRFGLGDAMADLSLYIGDEWLFRARFPDLEVNTRDRAVVEFRAARIFEKQEVLGYNQFSQLAEPGLKESVIPLLDLEAFEGQDRRDMELKLRNWSEGMREFLASHACAIGVRLLAVPDPSPERSGELRRLEEARVDAGLKAFALAPEHPVFRRNLLRIWKKMIREGKLKVAANLMAAGFSKLPGDKLLAYDWGLSYLLQEMYGAAGAAFEKALAIDDGFSRARLHYGIALFCRGDRVRGRRELERAVEECGGIDRLSDLTRGLALLILEGPREAEPYLEPFRSGGPWEGLIGAVSRQAASSGKESGKKPGEKKESGCGKEAAPSRDKGGVEGGDRT